MRIEIWMLEIEIKKSQTKFFGSLCGTTSYSGGATEVLNLLVIMDQCPGAILNHTEHPARQLIFLENLWLFKYNIQSFIAYSSLKPFFGKVSTPNYIFLSDF